MDLRPMVLGIPYTLICFRQTNPEDLPLLARSMFTPLLDFDPLLIEVERDGGTELVPILEHSGSRTSGTGWCDGWSEEESESDSDNWQHSVACALNWSKSRSDEQGESDQETATHQDSRSLSERLDPRASLLSPLDQTNARSSADALARGKGRSRKSGQSETEGGSRTLSDALGGAHVKGWGRGKSGGVSGNASQTEGWAVRHIQVRKTVREWQETGQLKRSIADQIEKFCQMLFCCECQEAYIRSGSAVGHMRTVDVPDPFLSASAIVKAVDWLARELKAIHEYLFVPDLSLAEEERRVRQYLGLDGQGDEPVEKAPARNGRAKRKGVLVN